MATSEMPDAEEVAAVKSKQQNIETSASRTFEAESAPCNTSSSKRPNQPPFVPAVRLQRSCVSTV
jgi:hypothetical protein